MSLRSYHNLNVDKIYIVIKEFTDFDKILHPVGEKWRFKASNFLPYEDGVSIFIEDGQNKIKNIRFRYTKDEQEMLLNNFMRYIKEI